MVNKAVLMILFMFKIVQNVHHRFVKHWQALLWATYYTYAEFQNAI
uniref:Uncharacterized protein n=1 Tax=Arundo donax TaxID=35708 RepID=A0A0A9BJN4_ARUDO